MTQWNKHSQKDKINIIVNFQWVKIIKCSVNLILHLSPKSHVISVNHPILHLIVDAMSSKSSSLHCKLKCPVSLPMATRTPLLLKHLIPHPACLLKTFQWPLILPKKRFSNLNICGNNPEFFKMQILRTKPTWDSDLVVLGCQAQPIVAQVPLPGISSMSTFPLLSVPCRQEPPYPTENGWLKKWMASHNYFEMKERSNKYTQNYSARFDKPRNMWVWQIPEMNASVGQRLKGNIWSIQLWFWLTFISDYP